MHETFPSPVLADPVEFVAVLVPHAVGVEAGHKAPFHKLAIAVGLTDKMTATTAGQDLQERYTHSAMQAVAL